MVSFHRKDHVFENSRYHNIIQLRLKLGGIIYKLDIYWNYIMFILSYQQIEPNELEWSIVSNIIKTEQLNNN